MPLVFSSARFALSYPNVGKGQLIDRWRHMMRAVLPTGA